MSLSNWKVALKLKWTKYCIVAAADADNADATSDVIFTIKDKKLYAPAITLSAKNNHKLSKRFSKGSKRSVYWNEYKTKSKNKNARQEYICFLETNFVDVNILFVLLYSNQDDNYKKN